MKTNDNINIRHDFQIDEIRQIYQQPLLQLISIASEVHRTYQNYKHMHISTLVSYKTGGCQEDCAYCAQSSKYQTHIDNKSHYLSYDEAIAQAVKAKEKGSKRICISASWRGIPNDKKLDEIIKIGKKVKEMDMEVCCTLGMVNSEHITKLKDAGFTAFNHNLDTSETFYPNITTTRSYADRLHTLQLLQQHQMPYCSGGIIGLGESEEDRLAMLVTLANQPTHPYSLPLNILVPITGTPLEQNETTGYWDMLRLIATARIIMPETIICLAAGRHTLNKEYQTLCFLAGANSIFTGEKLLTTDNCNPKDDVTLLQELGLTE